MLSVKCKGSDSGAATSLPIHSLGLFLEVSLALILPQASLLPWGRVLKLPRVEEILEGISSSMLPGRAGIFQRCLRLWKVRAPTVSGAPHLVWETVLVTSGC